MSNIYSLEERRKHQAVAARVARCRERKKIGYQIPRDRATTRPIELKPLVDGTFLFGDFILTEHQYLTLVEAMRNGSVFAPRVRNRAFPPFKVMDADCPWLNWNVMFE
jgi:hypothetical protein